MKKLIFIFLFLPYIIFCQDSYISPGASKLYLLTSQGASFIDLGRYSFNLSDINQYYVAHDTDWIDLPTYCQSLITPNDSSIIHPSIIDLNKYSIRTLNGYRYYLCATPLPEWPVDSMERTSIFGSNDKVTWVVPPGVTNPISPSPPVGYYGHDPDIFWDTDSLRIIYCAYADVGGIKPYFKMQSSVDGIAWDVKRLFQLTNFNDIMSPGVEKVNGTYYIYYAHYIADEIRILRRMHSTSLYGPWIHETCHIDSSYTVAFGASSAFYLSHMDINYIDGKWVAALNMRAVFEGPDNLYASNNYLAESTDGINFDLAKYPLFSQPYDSYQDSLQGNIAWDMDMYRFSMLYNTEDDIDCFYSAYGGMPLDYPVFVGKSKMLLKQCPELDIDKPYNTISNTRQIQLDSANLKQGTYAFCDDFARENSTTINPSSCGENWTISGTFAITDSLITRTSTSTAYMYTDADSVNIEGVAQLKWEQSVFNADGQFVIYLKANAGSQILKLSIGFNHTLILTYSGSVTTELARMYNLTINSADLNQVKWRVNGANVKVWVNGILYFDHILLASEVGGADQLALWQSGKRVFFVWTTTSQSSKIKNITIKNL